MKKTLFPFLMLTFLVIVFAKLTGAERPALIIEKPSEPPFIPSDKFDGKWVGKREDVSGDSICLETKITGQIHHGAVTLKLTYNNTILSGWISGSGELALYANSQRWGYRFSGHAQDGRIEGDWKVTNAACNGAWLVEKVNEST